MTVVSTPTNATLFPGGSFSGSTTLAGGQDPYPSGIAHPFVTLYHYDALGNLSCVEQHGDATGTACPTTPFSPTSPVPPDASNPWRLRRFGYNSLGQLLWASNPESGVITYSYDADGNLLQKTSPAPNQTGTATQTISYCYDALHRVTGKAYSAQTCQNGQLPVGTAVVSYTYDQGTNGIGRLTSLTDQAGTGAYTYDVMGRIATEQRVISGISKTISYDYYLDGSLKALHYPSGRIVTYTPDSAGRVTSVTDSNGTPYASSLTYWPNGTEYQWHLPNIYLSTTLNQRLQVSGFYSDNGQISSFFMNKTYNYGALHQNNGNVISIINNKDSNRTQTFAYDALNRITAGSSAAASGALSWGETYSIDPWGNLMISPMAGKAHGGTFQHAGDVSNRASGLGYDAAGNLTNYTAPGQYVYDAENRIQSTGGMTYTYDADGNRVKKTNGSTGTLYWYGGPGIIAESDLAGTPKSEYVFINGKRAARIDLPGNTVHYYLSDHLNSTSMVVSATGVVEDESDYSPFGTEYVVTSSGGNHYKFTGKERDSESGLDYFGARYYSNGLGRFITPDWAAKPAAVPYVTLGNPQTLNLYQYAYNNPTTLADNDGHEVFDYNTNKSPLVSPQDPNGSVGRDLLKMAAATTLLAAPEAGPLARALYGMFLSTAPVTVPTAMNIMEGMTPGPTGPSLNAAKVAESFALKSYATDGKVLAAEFQNGGAATLTFAKSESNLSVGVGFVASPEKAVGTLSNIEKGAQNLAKAEGASSLTIKAKDVTNPKLASILEKKGFTQEMKDGKGTGNWLRTYKIEKRK